LLNGTIIHWQPLIRYLGIFINATLSWSDHCRISVARATRTLNYLKRSLCGATRSAKAAAYTSLVYPILEYVCTVWNPHTSKNRLILECVQQRAARWACGSHWNPRKWSKSSVGLQLTWPDLSTRRNYCLLYDIINKHQSLPLPDSVKFNNFSTRSHSLSLVPLCSTINCYRFLFFVNIIFLWNSVPHSILSLSCTGFRRTLYRYLCNYC